MKSLLAKIKKHIKKILFTIFVGGVAFASIGEEPELDQAVLDDIAVMQAEYFAKHGHYLQVLRNNGKPHDMEENFPRQIPNDYYIQIYRNEHGYGYEVLKEEIENFHVRGYGNEATIRTGKRPNIKTIPQ